MADNGFFSFHEGMHGIGQRRDDMLFFPQRGSNFKGAAVNHGPLTWVDQNGLGRLMGAQSAGDSLMRIQKNRHTRGLMGIPVF